jgi:imidazolonepropionase-like amidohydrolase
MMGGYPIARVWSGHVPAAEADGFHRHLLATGVADVRAVDRGAALRTITINPATILGLDNRVGALRPGLDADIVLWSGDPLDVMSRPLRVFIGGRDVYHYDTERAAGITADPYYRG